MLRLISGVVSLGTETVKFFIIRGTGCRGFNRSKSCIISTGFIDYMWNSSGFAQRFIGGSSSNERRRRIAGIAKNNLKIGESTVCIIAPEIFVVRDILVYWTLTTQIPCEPLCRRLIRVEAEYSTIVTVKLLAIEQGFNMFRDYVHLNRYWENSCAQFFPISQENSISTIWLYVLS